MRLSKPYPTTSKSLRSDNVKICYYANIIGDTFVQTWYTVHAEYGWKSVRRQFDKLVDAKNFAKTLVFMNDKALSIVLVEHVADSHVIDWKN